MMFICCMFTWLQPILIHLTVSETLNLQQNMESRKSTSSRLNRVYKTEMNMYQRLADYRVKLGALQELLERQMNELEQKDILIEQLAKKNSRENDQYKRRISYLESKQSDLSQRYADISRRSSLQMASREPATVFIELDIAGARRDIEVTGQTANGQRISLEVEREKWDAYQESESTVYGDEYEEVDDGSRNLELEIAFM